MLNDRFNTRMKWIYLIALMVSIFTGFGNMPLYGRFFVSDIPGFGWSADFFILLYVHYLSGAALLMVSTYFVILYSRRSSKIARLSITGIARVTVLCLVLITGIMSAIKNLPSVNLSMVGLMVVAFTHLGAAMIFILLSISFRIFKRPWLREMFSGQTQDLDKIKNL